MRANGKRRGGGGGGGAVGRRLVEAAERLRAGVDRLRFAEPVTHVYNPLDYAWESHAEYLERFGGGGGSGSGGTGDRGGRVVFMGMNPGPFGMAQTGVPFGEVAAVRDWMGIEAPVGRPAPEHPKRVVEGFACTRSEVSGRRLWGLFAERFGDAATFFDGHFVVNYCPLVFMEESGRNRTPDKLPSSERAALERVCDGHLAEVFEALQPAWAVGVGAFARARIEKVLGAGAGTAAPRVAQVLHPSPASPAANRGWAGAATRQLVEAGVWQGGT